MENTKTTVEKKVTYTNIYQEKTKEGVYCAYVNKSD